MIFSAWRYGREDPWRLHNMLDEDFRRVWDPSLPAVRPKYPERVQRFVLACGKAAAIIERQMEDDRPSQRRKGRRRDKRRPRPSVEGQR